MFPESVTNSTRTLVWYLIAFLAQFCPSCTYPISYLRHTTRHSMQSSMLSHDLNRHLRTNHPPLMHLFKCNTLHFPSLNPSPKWVPSTAPTSRHSSPTTATGICRNLKAPRPYPRCQRRSLTSSISEICCS
ncbi:hypothetical protein BXZ70DRAFT_952488 [Cristinia sonorae]|uniref:Uncharacterized protein n=1 Tax=Cristinia sonorae TaxID=1940300 RepID=A0A8K0XLW9_9AGAR|nr:hypothetical protein BXZ70DRAFT_952488 [Cristinia sonorae]